MYLGGAAVKFFPSYKTFIKPVFKFADAIVVGSGYLENEFSKIGIKPNIIPAVINLDEEHSFESLKFHNTLNGGSGHTDGTYYNVRSVSYTHLTLPTSDLV